MCVIDYSHFNHPNKIIISDTLHRIAIKELIMMPSFAAYENPQCDAFGRPRNIMTIVIPRL